MDDEMSLSLEGEEDLPGTPRERRDLFVELKRQERAAKTELERVSARLLVLAPMIIHDLEDEDTPSLKLSCGATLYIHKETYARVIDKENLVTEFESHGFRDLLTINSQTLSSLVREKLQEGELPDWMARVVEPSTRFSPRLRGLK